ncbi:DUF4225 domain-containing protein [Serratia ficaria]|uniref:DUF4225 domain-containing protein n=1 Tax=Serratia ficaria TaxID=61651 RepID=UPI0021827245|nr:DUF4225 domain-containing protein [Serratia ficaria]CAI2457806.1 Uncharacterised protein [Serratia ficaria]
MDNPLQRNERLNAYTQTMARQQARSLLGLVERISRNHLKDPATLAAFRHEMLCFANDKLQKCQKTGPAANIAVLEMQREYQALIAQDRLLQSQNVTPYAVLKKKTNTDGVVTYILYGIGILSGIGQIILGFGLDWTGVGAIPGTLLMLNGINNLYENGYALLFAKSTVGPGRMVYRLAAHGMGYGNSVADMIYGGMDLGLSAYGFTRLVLKPESWRLFRYINSDYVRGWREMSKAAMMLEGFSDVATLRGIYTAGHTQQ